MIEAVIDNDTSRYQYEVIKKLYMLEIIYLNNT